MADIEPQAWTEELPTKDGWYWLDTKQIQIVLVDDGNVYFMHEDGPSHVTSFQGMLWFGPIQPPPK